MSQRMICGCGFRGFGKYCPECGELLTKMDPDYLAETPCTIATAPFQGEPTETAPAQGATIEPVPGAIRPETASEFLKGTIGGTSFGQLISDTRPASTTVSDEGLTLIASACTKSGPFVNGLMNSSETVLYKRTEEEYEIHTYTCAMSSEEHHLAYSLPKEAALECIRRIEALEIEHYEKAFSKTAGAMLGTYKSFKYRKKDGTIHKLSAENKMPEGRDLISEGRGILASYIDSNRSI